MQNLSLGLEELLKSLIEKNQNIHDRLIKDSEIETERAIDSAERAWGLSIELGDYKLAMGAEERVARTEERADRAWALAHDCKLVVDAAKATLANLRAA